MKNIFKKFSLLIIFVACIQQLVLALDIKPYYTCPSDMFYTPTMTLEKYCNEIRILINDDTFRKKYCKASYNEQYGQANLEYNRGQCRLSDKKFVEGIYNGGTCSVSFTLNPVPKIIGISSRNKGGLNGSDGPECINMLKKELQRIYTNIEDFDY